MADSVLIDYEENKWRRGVYALIFHAEEGDKVYIGSTTVSFSNRIKNHASELRNKKHRNRHLQHLWDKYKTFEIKVLEICDGMSEIGIRKREEEWVSRAAPENLVNLGPVIPSPGFGKRVDDETKKKISAASKDHWRDPEYRERRRKSASKAFKGRKLSEEHKKALSRSHAGKPLHEEHRKNMVASVRAAWENKSAEELEKIGQKSRETWQAFHDAGRSVPPLSEDTRKKMSQAQRKRWNEMSPKERAEFCLKIREGIKKRRDKETENANG